MCAPGLNTRAHNVHTAPYLGPTAEGYWGTGSPGRPQHQSCLHTCCVNAKGKAWVLSSSTCLLRGWSSLEMWVSTVRSLPDHQLICVGEGGGELFIAEHMMF